MAEAEFTADHPEDLGGAEGVEAGGGVELERGIAGEGTLARGARITNVWPTRMILPLNPFSFRKEEMLTPQRRAILARVSLG